MKNKEELIAILEQVVEEVENDPTDVDWEEEFQRKLQQPCRPFPHDLIQ